MKLNPANLSIIPLSSNLKFSALIESPSVRSEDEKSKGQESDDHECDYQGYREKCCHLWFLPKNEIFVFFEVVTIEVDKYQSLASAFLHLEKFVIQALFGINIELLLHLFELVVLAMVITQIFYQFLIHDLFIFLDFVSLF